MLRSCLLEAIELSKIDVGDEEELLKRVKKIEESVHVIAVLIFLYLLAKAFLFFISL